MRTVSKTIYKFSELDDRAKERARNWYRAGGCYHWGDDNVASLKAFADWFNLKIRNYSLGGSDNRSQGVDFDLNVDDWLEEMSGVRLWKYLNSNNRFHLPDLSGNCPFTGYCFDETLLDPVRDFMKRPDLRLTYRELMSECIDKFCTAFAEDVDYAHSDEAVDESIEANEYEFDEDGHIA